MRDRRLSLNEKGGLLTAASPQTRCRCCCRCCCAPLCSSAAISAVGIALLELLLVCVLWLAGFGWDIGQVFSDTESGWSDYRFGAGLADVALFATLGVFLAGAAMLTGSPVSDGPSKAAAAVAGLTMLRCIWLTAKLIVVITGEGGGPIYTARVAAVTVSTAMAGAAFFAHLYAARLISAQWLPVFDLVRYVLSTGISGTAAAVVSIGISRSESVLPGPPPAIVVLLVVSVALLWHLEGVQVAILAVRPHSSPVCPARSLSAAQILRAAAATVGHEHVMYVMCVCVRVRVRVTGARFGGNHLPVHRLFCSRDHGAQVEGANPATFVSGSRAQRLQQVMLKGHNLKRFLVGRQFFVIFVVYLTASVTTFP
jgi:hypothetical protein